MEFNGNYSSIGGAGVIFSLVTFRFWSQLNRSLHLNEHASVVIEFRFSLQTSCFLSLHPTKFKLNTWKSISRKAKSFLQLLGHILYWKLENKLFWKLSNKIWDRVTNRVEFLKILIIYWFIVKMDLHWHCTSLDKLFSRCWFYPPHHPFSLLQVSQEKMTLLWVQ